MDKQVYVVYLEDGDYRAFFIYGVFSTLEYAQNFVKEHCVENPGDELYMDILESSIDSLRVA